MLPRPWTVARIRPLFEAAAARLAESQKQSGVRPEDRVSDEWEALVEHLGAMLVASRDPGAVLALGQVLEGPDFVGKCPLSSGLLLAFGSDPDY